MLKILEYLSDKMHGLQSILLLFLNEFNIITQLVQFLV